MYVHMYYPGPQLEGAISAISYLKEQCLIVLLYIYIAKWPLLANTRGHFEKVSVL